MSFYYQNITNEINLFALLQGLFIGIFFIINSIVKKNRYNLLFGFFMITYSAELILSLLNKIHYIELYPRLEYLPVNFSFLSLPLFYLYVKNISVFDIKFKDYRILIPGLIEFIFNSLLFIFYKENVSYNNYLIIYNILFILYNYYVLKLIIRLESKHNDIIYEQYSSVEGLSLRWCKNTAVIFLFFLLIISISFFLNMITSNDFLILDLIFSVINIFIIYWLSIKALEQKVVRSLLNFSKNKQNNTTESLNETVVNNDFKIIELNIINKELYKIVDLTILSLSKHIDLHPKRISKVINYKTNKNFNNYINTFRVNEAKKMLIDENFNHLSIEGIGYEAGFKSKSVFYNSFKKITGLTPSKLRQSTIMY
jgi:AraC-like DNA-binding protein